MPRHIPVLDHLTYTHSDLVFVLDCTGSMQRYINSVRDHIFGICDMIRGEEGLNGADDLRVAVSQLRATKKAQLADRTDRQLP